MSGAGDAGKHGKAKKAAKKPEDDTAWRRPQFNASEYIVSTALLPHEVPSVDPEEAGNPRPVVPEHVQALVDSFLANPPTHITLTTWENRGVFQTIPLDLPFT